VGDNGEEYLVLERTSSASGCPLKITVRQKSWVWSNLQAQVGTGDVVLKKLRDAHVMRMLDLEGNPPSLTSMQGVVTHGSFDGVATNAATLRTPTHSGTTRQKLLAVVTTDSVGMLERFKVNVESCKMAPPSSSKAAASASSEQQQDTKLKYSIHVEVNRVNRDEITTGTRSLLGQCVLLNRRLKLDSFVKMWPVAASRFVHACDVLLVRGALAALSSLLQRPQPLMMLRCCLGAKREVVELTPAVLQSKGGSSSSALKLSVGHHCAFNFKARTRNASSSSTTCERKHTSGCAGRAACQSTRKRPRDEQDVEPLDPKRVFAVLQRHLRIVDASVLRHVTHDIVALQTVNSSKPAAASAASASTVYMRMD